MRNPDTTKHDYGHALLIAGSHGRMGCAILAARAALRSGCGLLTVHLPSRCVDPMQVAFPEAMVSIDPSPTLFSAVPSQTTRYTAIAAGPGLGTDATTQQALHDLLATLQPPNSETSDFRGVPSARPTAPTSELNSDLRPTPLVLDADALNILALHPEWLPLAAGAIITPHAGEYRRLFGDADPQRMAARHHLVIVAKAHHTRVYSPDGQCFENHTGNAGMATAGSGDVLTGILLGMLCSNHLQASTFEIVCRAVQIHGQLGDIAVQSQSQSSLIASDMVENLRHVSTDITAS